MRAIRYSLAVLFLATTISWGQRVIIETGRPKQFIVKNAQEIASKKFKVHYKYVAYNRTPEQLDSIRKLNETTFAYLESKFGEDWRNKIDLAVKYELENLNLFQALLLKNSVITADNLVYYKKKGKKYQGLVYPSIEPEAMGNTPYIYKLSFFQKEGKTMYKGN